MNKHCNIILSDIIIEDIKAGCSMSAKIVLRGLEEKRFLRTLVPIIYFEEEEEKGRKQSLYKKACVKKKSFYSFKENKKVVSSWR